MPDQRMDDGFGWVEEQWYIYMYTWSFKFDGISRWVIA